MQRDRQPSTLTSTPGANFEWPLLFALWQDPALTGTKSSTGRQHKLGMENGAFQLWRDRAPHCTSAADILIYFLYLSLSFHRGKIQLKEIIKSPRLPCCSCWVHANVWPQVSLFNLLQTLLQCLVCPSLQTYWKLDWSTDLEGRWYGALHRLTEAVSSKTFLCFSFCSCHFSTVHFNSVAWLEGIFNFIPGIKPMLWKHLCQIKGFLCKHVPSAEASICTQFSFFYCRWREAHQHILKWTLISHTSWEAEHCPIMPFNTDCVADDTMHFKSLTICRP